MKATKIIYWTTTVLIFLFEGMVPALTFNSQLARQGISHLGYPVYFGNALVVFKVLGALGLLLPIVQGRAKEWVYAGFAFDFVFAFISLVVVDGFKGMSFFPLIVLAVLVVSYVTYHKLQSASNKTDVKTKKVTSMYQ